MAFRMAGLVLAICVFGAAFLGACASRTGEVSDAAEVSKPSVGDIVDAPVLGAPVPDVLREDGVRVVERVEPAAVVASIDGLWAETAGGVPVMEISGDRVSYLYAGAFPSVTGRLKGVESCVSGSGGEVMTGEGVYELVLMDMPPTECTRMVLDGDVLTMGEPGTESYILKRVEGRRPLTERVGVDGMQGMWINLRKNWRVLRVDGDSMAVDLADLEGESSRIRDVVSCEGVEGKFVERVGGDGTSCFAVERAGDTIALVGPDGRISPRSLYNRMR